MLTTEKNFKCDDCGTVTTFSGYRQARAAGWAISKNYVRCYCYNCAPAHRRGNAANKIIEGYKMLKNLKILRKETGLSQNQVAEKLNVSQQTYSDYENCKTEPTSETLIEIAKFFDVSVDYLLGITDDFGARVPAGTATTANAMGDTLTAQERELLELFRELSPYLQGMTMEAVKSWAKKNNNGEQKKA